MPRVCARAVRRPGRPTSNRCSGRHARVGWRGSSSGDCGLRRRVGSRRQLSGPIRLPSGPVGTVSPVGPVRREGAGPGLLPARPGPPAAPCGLRRDSACPRIRRSSTGGPGDQYRSRKMFIPPAFAPLDLPGVAPSQRQRILRPIVFDDVKRLATRGSTTLFTGEIATVGLTVNLRGAVLGRPVRRGSDGAGHGARSSVVLAEPSKPDRRSLGYGVVSLPLHSARGV